MLFGWSFRINGGTSMHMFGRLCNGMELFIIWKKILSSWKWQILFNLIYFSHLFFFLYKILSKFFKLVIKINTLTDKYVCNNITNTGCQNILCIYVIYYVYILVVMLGYQGYFVVMIRMFYAYIFPL